MRGRPPEVTLGAVSLNSHVQTPHSGRGIVLAIGLVRIDESVCSIVGLVEVLGLYLRSLFKGLAGVDICFPKVSAKGRRHSIGPDGQRTLLLHLEGICGLHKEVGSILVLFFSAAEEAEAAAGTLQRLLGLCMLLVVVFRGETRRDRTRRGRGDGPSGVEREGLEP